MQGFLTVFLADNIIAQKMKFSIKDFFSKCDQIRRKLRSRLIILLTENLFSLKGSGFEELDFILIYKCENVHSRAANLT